MIPLIIKTQTFVFSVDDIGRDIVDLPEIKLT